MKIEIKHQGASWCLEGLNLHHNICYYLCQGGYVFSRVCWLVDLLAGLCRNTELGGEMEHGPGRRNFQF